MRYLIGEAMYGGWVTDDFDWWVLVTYLNEYLGEFIFDKNQKFYFSKAGFNYKIPEPCDLNKYIEHIQKIPLTQTPELFGLHPNAEIQYFTNAAKDLWFNIIQMQTNDVTVGSGINREEYIESVATDIKSKLPECFDLFNIAKAIEIPTPTQIVLL